MEFLPDLIFQLVLDGPYFTLQRCCKDTSCWPKRALEWPAEGSEKSARMGHHPLDHSMCTEINTLWCCVFSMVELRSPRMEREEERVAPFSITLNDLLEEFSSAPIMLGLETL